MSGDLGRARVFWKRALHLACQEMIADAALPAKQPMLPMPATHLAYYLLYRAGIPADVIAALAGVPRKAIARRLLLTMALMGNDEIWERIEALAEEMGRARYSDPGCNMAAFPGPSELVRRELLSEGAP